MPSAASAPRGVSITTWEPQYFALTLPPFTLKKRAGLGERHRFLARGTKQLDEILHDGTVGRGFCFGIDVRAVLEPIFLHTTSRTICILLN